MAILHETPDVAIHRRPSGLCALVQQHPPPQHRHDVPKFRVSNRVRISKFKRLFEKGYMANLSEEMFTIHEVHPSDPPVYRLIDDLGEVLDGTFYEPELQKVSVPIDKVYRVESVLQRRKVGRRTEVLVKWYGYPSKFNSWVDAEALVRYKV